MACESNIMSVRKFRFAPHTVIDNITPAAFGVHSFLGSPGLINTHPIHSFWQGFFYMVGASKLLQ